MTHLRRSDEGDGGRPHPSLPLAWLREPDAIYRRSFQIIDAETDWSGVPPLLRTVAQRMIHACGMVDLVADLAWSDDMVARSVAALGAGAPVLVDCRMVAEGVIRSLLPADNPVVTALDHVSAPVPGTTRSAAAIDAVAAHLDGAVVVVGNAPTALFRLLERCVAGASRPAAILGFPVGFVGAAESKAALAALAPAPFLTVHGRRGGSAIAAGALNALAALAGRDRARMPA